MVEVLELIRNRKWDSIVILSLLLIIGLAGPMATARAVSLAIEEEMAPFIADLAEIKEITIDEVSGGGIAGYKKFIDYENENELFTAMDKSTQNAEAIRRALNVPQARDVLVKLDSSKVAMFERYFNR